MLTIKSVICLLSQERKNKNLKPQKMPTTIDWRAFWTSMATILIALAIYAIVIEPVVSKYKIKVVKG
jgi:hypothetical protein